MTQDIDTWLEGKVRGMVASQPVTGPERFSEKACFQPLAKSLWLQAEAAGYSVADLKDACGGDVERYLLDRYALAEASRGSEGMNSAQL